MREDTPLSTTACSLDGSRVLRRHEAPSRLAPREASRGLTDTPAAIVACREIAGSRIHPDYCTVSQQKELVAPQGAERREMQHNSPAQDDTKRT